MGNTMFTKLKDQVKLTLSLLFFAMPITKCTGCSSPSTCMEMNGLRECVLCNELACKLCLQTYHHDQKCNGCGFIGTACPVADDYKTNVQCTAGNTRPRLCPGCKPNPWQCQPCTIEAGGRMAFADKDALEEHNRKFGHSGR